MKAIFYDLETSDKNPVGQILNFAFLRVDEDFHIEDECCGTMQLTRLQLPSPDAILANRVDVLQHQKTAQYTEKEGLHVIWKFLSQVSNDFRDGVILVGYNSSRFDLNFLRTSLIRNGLSPYFRNVSYGDMLHLSKKLYMTHPEFPQLPSLRGEEGIASLSLEALTRHFGFLDGRQEHESRADAVLTVQLAKLYREKFGLDIFRYQPYEAVPFQKEHAVIAVRFPCYEIAKGKRFAEAIFAFHQSDHRYALWISLDRWKEGKRGRAALSWFKSKGDALCVIGEKKLSDEDFELLKEIRNEVDDINLLNFFADSKCDIEQDIYRIDAQQIDILRKAIWEKDARSLKATDLPDLHTLYQRHAIANYSWGMHRDEKVRSLLAEYARYRYGGRMLMVKGAEPAPFEEGVYLAQYHDTLGEYVGRIQELRADPAVAADTAILRLLVSLEEYYRQSDLVAAAGDNLLCYQRVKSAAA